MGTTGSNADILGASRSTPLTSTLPQTVSPNSPATSILPIAHTADVPATRRRIIRTIRCNFQAVLRPSWIYLRPSWLYGSHKSPSVQVRHSDEEKEAASPVDDTGQAGTDTRSTRSTSETDIVIRDLEKFPTGYPNLGAFVDSNENFMMYRRFGYLQARVLLQKQDELRELEGELDQIDQQDLETNMGRLLQRKEQGDDRFKLLTRVEEKFCEYARVISAAQQMMSFNKPTSGEHRSAMNYIHNVGPVDDDESAYVQHKEDLITLRPRRDYAWLDALIEKMLRSCHCRLVEYLFCSKESSRKSTDANNVYYAQERIAICALSIILLMILFLLVVPTYMLFHLVNSETAKGHVSPRVNSLSIGILLIFTLLFSAALSFFTEAKRHEILGAAAAYCAVLVVFLGNVGSVISG